MSNLDQFESIFRSAAKPQFEYEVREFNQILTVSDKDGKNASQFADDCKNFLRDIVPTSAQWHSLAGNEFRTTQDLLSFIEGSDYDLICTYRNLHSPAWKYPHSLGAHLDVLMQKTDIATLVMPHPDADRAKDNVHAGPAEVLAMTDHLIDDALLINCALASTRSNGRLYLVHIEDQQTFDRYIQAIGKIPQIDSELAISSLRKQLLKEPADFIDSVRQVLSQSGHPVEIFGEAKFGHHLSEYRALIENQSIDLLVMNTKKEDQQAMHGLAYALAVEIRSIPVMML